MSFAPTRKMLSVTLHTCSIFVLQHEIYRHEDVFCRHNLWQKIRKCLQLADVAHPNANVFKSEVNSVRIQAYSPIMAFLNLILTDGISFNLDASIELERDTKPLELWAKQDCERTTLLPFYFISSTVKELVWNMVSSYFMNQISPDKLFLYHQDI